MLEGTQRLLFFNFKRPNIKINKHDIRAPGHAFPSRLRSVSERGTPTCCTLRKKNKPQGILRVYTYSYACSQQSY